MKITIHHAGQTREATVETYQAVMDEMVRDLGPWVPGVSRVEREQSTFEAQVTDTEAKARIEAVHKALNDAGVNVDASRQLYATGTRMADVGYVNQAARAVEHESKEPARDAINRLIERVRAEKRRDYDTTAGKLAGALTMNGAIKFEGFKLREQAIRGLLGRLGSPALRYVLGLRDRIADKGETTTEAHRTMDRAALLEVVQHECKRFADVPLKLRMREGLGDIFAVTSPEYGVADAPDVLPSVLRALPENAKATFSYDPITTTWEVRASVWTPTPVEAQAVGEPFEGYSSFLSRDNATLGLTPGGGIVLLACLNAGTYVAETNGEGRRVHRGRILYNLPDMVQASMRAITALCKVWGEAQKDEIAVGLLPIEEVIPGFYRHMLTARRGELVGVLPGRTEQHVAALAKTFESERRDRNRIVRADLANGWTKYIQGESPAVRRDAEAAIGRWMVKSETVRYAQA